jgi:hypothetical protein
MKVKELIKALGKFNANDVVVMKVSDLSPDKEGEAVVTSATKYYKDVILEDKK